jgi:hypothetical protein
VRFCTQPGYAGNSWVWRTLCRQYPEFVTLERKSLFLKIIYVFYDLDKHR